MKRSEMIKLITDYLQGVTTLTPEDNNLAASQLLTYIEEAGMLPPEANIKRSRELSPGQEILFFEKLNKWEAE